MSIFSRLKSKVTSISDLNDKWSVPETEEELEKLFDKQSGLNLIYKHSYTCMTCIFIMKRVEELMSSDKKIDSFQFIEVRMSRPLSNFVSEKTGIKHESPQAILLHNGDVKWHASHSAIKIDAILNALKEIS